VLHEQNTAEKIFYSNLAKQELIRRRDSERERFYDHIVEYFKI